MLIRRKWSNILLTDNFADKVAINWHHRRFISASIQDRTWSIVRSTAHARPFPIRSFFVRNLQLLHTDGKFMLRSTRWSLVAHIIGGRWWRWVLMWWSLLCKNISFLPQNSHTPYVMWSDLQHITRARDNKNYFTTPTPPYWSLASLNADAENHTLTCRTLCVNRIPCRCC